MPGAQERQSEFEAFYWQLLEKVAEQYEVPDLLPIRTAFSVFFTFGIMDGLLTKRLRAANLTIPGFNSLVLLAHGNPDGYPLSELSRFLVSSRANATGVVDSLVKKGFVVRTDHREDRRVIIAKITPKGRRWLDGYFPGHSRMMASFASALSKEERATLIRLLGKMRQGIVKNVAAMEKAKP